MIFQHCCHRYDNPMLCFSSWPFIPSASHQGPAATFLPKKDTMWTQALIVYWGRLPWHTRKCPYSSPVAFPRLLCSSVEELLVLHLIHLTVTLNTKWFFKCQPPSPIVMGFLALTYRCYMQQYTNDEYYDKLSCHPQSLKMIQTFWAVFDLF